MKCIGFGPTEGHCPNKAGTKRSKYWCEDCEKARLAHITAALEGLLRNLTEVNHDPR